MYAQIKPNTGRVKGITDRQVMFNGRTVSSRDLLESAGYHILGAQGLAMKAIYLLLERITADKKMYRFALKQIVKRLAAAADAYDKRIDEHYAQYIDFVRDFQFNVSEALWHDAEIFYYTEKNLLDKAKVHNSSLLALLDLTHVLIDTAQGTVDVYRDELLKAGITTRFLARLLDFKPVSSAVGDLAAILTKGLPDLSHYKEQKALNDAFHIIIDGVMGHDKINDCLLRADKANRDN